VYEGEVAVLPVSPFEIFPDRLSAESLDEVRSLIHARAVSVDEVYENFGVEVTTGTSSFTPALTADSLLSFDASAVAE
jgi:hypothetical protein